jgi:hypothetical protein
MRDTPALPRIESKTSIVYRVHVLGVVGHALQSRLRLLVQQHFLGFVDLPGDVCGTTSVRMVC